jgi:ubiquinone biosynthesis protein COQ9
MTSGYDRELDRQRLLTAILNHVAFDGWSETALRAAGQETGIPAERVLNAFPGGAKDVLILWHEVADQQMIAGMGSPEIAHLRTRERAGCTVLLLPQNATIATRLLYNTVNAIWYAVGDKSTDYNFYTKRALLAGVYSATVMYWLNDKSPDCAATWSFLERRIADVMRVPQLVGQATSRLRELADRLPAPSNLFRHGRMARGRRRAAH